MPGPSTRAIHADRDLAELPDVAPAIRPSTTFVEGTGRRYRRSSHETTERFEAVIGSLEGGHAVAYASGMAAAAAAITYIDPRRVALPEVVYHGVRELVRSLEARELIEVVGEDELGAGDLLWVETPSNPFCVVTDLEDAVGRAHAAGAVVVCDATFATPINLSPLAFGVDVVMHSATKSIAGHSDVLGGVLVVPDESGAEALCSGRLLTGAVPGSLDSWLALRGVRTLALRMERAAASAAAVAEAMEGNGVRTWYPGLASHASHDIAVRQMSGMGSMLTLDLVDGEGARRFVDALTVFTNATSLGGVESLAEIRAMSDPSIGPGIIRLSVGIEDTDDLVADVLGAYESAQRS